jgi:hypothetical protein
MSVAPNYKFSASAMSIHIPIGDIFARLVGAYANLE